MLGILGGIGPASTIRYYEMLTYGHHARTGNHAFPELVIHSIDFQRFTKLEREAKRTAYVSEIVNGVRVLERAGATLGMIAANSAHAVFEEVAEQCEIELLSVVECTLAWAKDAGFRHVLLLGISATAEAGFYDSVFSREGLEILLPEKAHQERIDRIVFDELVVGIVSEEARMDLLAMSLAPEIDAVILGCTELGLLTAHGWSGPPLLDTVEIHVAAALHRLAQLEGR